MENRHLDRSCTKSKVGSVSGFKNGDEAGEQWQWTDLRWGWRTIGEKWVSDNEGVEGSWNTL